MATLRTRSGTKLTKKVIDALAEEAGTLASVRDARSGCW